MPHLTPFVMVRMYPRIVLYMPPMHAIAWKAISLSCVLVLCSSAFPQACRGGHVQQFVSNPTFLAQILVK